jgi:TPR repeat protein
LQAASLAENLDAEVEYAIALFNGTGTPRNQPAAVALLRKAARQGSAIAQNRLAYVLVNGMGAAVDKVEGLKWHLVAKTQGKYDPTLDQELSRLSLEDRAKAEALAHRWLGDKLDAPAATGQPTPKAAPRATTQAIPFLTPQGGLPGLPLMPAPLAPAPTPLAPTPLAPAPLAPPQPGATKR